MKILLDRKENNMTKEKKTFVPFTDDVPLFSPLVPAPQHLTLERQLNKSVLIGWTPPDPPGNQMIESYHVYVNGVLKVTVKANERTRALVEGVDLNRVSDRDDNIVASNSVNKIKIYEIIKRSSSAASNKRTKCDA